MCQSGRRTGLSKLFAIIKKLVYTGSTHNLNICHNRAMAHLNLMNLYQDKFQNIQYLRDQYMAMQKMCDELGLRFGRCDDDAKAVLKEKGNDEPTSAQIKKATDKIEEEHHMRKAHQADGK